MTIGLRRKQEDEQVREQPQRDIDKEVDQHLGEQEPIKQQQQPKQQDYDYPQGDRQLTPQQRLQERIARQNQVKIPMRSFLFVVNDAEQSDKVVVKAEDIMIAIMKFAQTYHEECYDWLNIALYVEEIESVE